MAYRDDQKCHICGEPTRLVCQGCQEAMCEAHSLASRLEGAAAGAQEAAERLIKRLGSADMCERCVAAEIEASSGPYVMVVRLDDPITSQMVVEALQREGFDARVLGTHHAALVGAAQSIFEQRVEVPRGQATEAEALVRELLGAVDEGEAATADDEDDDEPEAQLESAAPLARRARGIAAGLCFIFPGGGHYYSRRPWTGLVLTGLCLVALAIFAAGAFASGAVALLGVPAADLAGSQLSLEAVNRGKRASAIAQLGRGLMLATLVLALTMFAGGR